MSATLSPLSLSLQAIARAHLGMEGSTLHRDTTPVINTGQAQGRFSFILAMRATLQGEVLWHNFHIVNLHKSWRALVAYL